MSGTFFEYLRREQDRLEQELMRARQQHAYDEVKSLRQQQKIVRDQHARWSRDLFADQVAA